MCETTTISSWVCLAVSGLTMDTFGIHGSWQLQLGVLAILELQLNLEHAWACGNAGPFQHLRDILSGSLATYDGTCQASNCSRHSCLAVHIHCERNWLCFEAVGVHRVTLLRSHVLIADYLKVPSLDLGFMLSDFSPILTRGHCFSHAGPAVRVDAMLTRLQAMFARQLGSPFFTMQQASRTEGLYDCCHLWQLLSRSPDLLTQVRSHGVNEHKRQAYMSMSKTGLL